MAEVEITQFLLNKIFSCSSLGKEQWGEESGGEGSQGGGGGEDTGG